MIDILKLLKRRKKDVKKEGGYDLRLYNSVRRVVVDGREYLIKEVKGVTDTHLLAIDVNGELVSIPIYKLQVGRKDQEEMVLNDYRDRAVLL